MFVLGAYGAAGVVDAAAELRPERFPVEAVLSAPFPQGIEAAPVSAMVAFVLNDRGVRNLWLAAGPEFAARRLTGFTEDDGIELSTLRFSPDETQLLFVRGAPANRAGELPNPASLPQGVEHAMYRVALRDDAVVRIDDGSEPSIHPSGESVAYVKQGAVWRASLLDAQAEPMQLFSARGGLGTLRWSPDGSQLAFVSARGTHSLIGVWTAPAEGAETDAGSIRWLAPSLDLDGSPVWSPDGTQLAFLRLPTRDLERFPFEPVRDDLPWSIRVADVARGSSREVFRAEEGMGSAYRGIVGRSQIFWGAKDRIVFAWERSGWLQLYSVPSNGGQVKALTTGAFEVEFVTLTPDRGAVVFASNQDDADRRHLWRVAVSGGRPQLLTPGDGIEWAPAPLASGELAFLRADALRPARVALRLRGGEIRDLAPDTVPAGFPADLVVPRAVQITATDGLRVPGQLFVPAGLEAGQRVPAVMFLHGGSRRQMLLGWHKRGYYHNAYGMSQYLASRGVVALALNYRSGTGYGLEFREADGYGATGATEVRDVLGAGLFLQSHPQVDPERIGVWGGSYGGYLTAQALAQASETFAVGVDIHGVHDWNEGIRTFVPSYNAADFPERWALARRSSPLSHLDGWRSPVLLIHADDDRNVAFAQSARLSRSLRERGVHVEQLTFPDDVHGFMLHRNWVAAYRATAEFLLRHLRN